MQRALARLDPQRYWQEPAYVAALLARLDGVAYSGAEGRVEFQSTIVADRGPKSAESRFGADFVIVARLRAGDEVAEKAVMAQAKKGSLPNLPQHEAREFREQCGKIAHSTDAVLGMEVPVSSSDTVLVREIRVAGGTSSDEAPPTPRLEMGRPLDLAEYLLDRLLACHHGDQNPAFVAAVGESKLSTLKLIAETSIAEPPRVYTFNAVTVDATGKETKRLRGQAEGHVDGLGDGVSLEMIRVPGGTFLMGSADDDPQGHERERPQHALTIAEFAAGRFPVTQAQWRVVARLPKLLRDMDAAPSHFKADERPVENVSWHDAEEFCARLSAKTGRSYRLPSEAEWEYAARAGTSSAFCFGDTLTPELANYDSAHGGTTPVGQFEIANAFGLCDVHGNLCEWCQDHWHDHYDGAPADGRAWTEGGDAALRVLRGGAWPDYARDCRSAARRPGQPEYRSGNVGFRVVCAVSRTQS